MTDKQKSPEEVVAWLAREIAPQWLPGRVKIQLTDILRERDAYWERRVGELVEVLEASWNKFAGMECATETFGAPSPQELRAECESGMDLIETVLAKFREGKCQP